MRYCSNMAICTHRWQEDRRKNYPTDANLARRVEEARQRAERGDIDVDVQTKRFTLMGVLQLQRKLGLARAAGTDSMHLNGPQDGPFYGAESSSLHRFESHFLRFLTAA